MEPEVTEPMFTGVTLPFDVAELLTAAMDLLGVVAPLVLLGISFVVVPKFIGLINKSMTKGGNK